MKIREPDCSRASTPGLRARATSSFMSMVIEVAGGIWMKRGKDWFRFWQRPSRFLALAVRPPRVALLAAGVWMISVIARI